MPWPSLLDCKQCQLLEPLSEPIDIKDIKRGVRGGSLSPPGAAGATFQYSAASLCCLPDRLGAVMIPVADVLGMEGPSAKVLFEAGSAPELSDCASEPHNMWKDASSVIALTAVTMSSWSGLDTQGSAAEGCWLSLDAKLACT